MKFEKTRKNKGRKKWWNNRRSIFAQFALLLQATFCIAEIQVEKQIHDACLVARQSNSASFCVCTWNKKQELVSQNKSESDRHLKSKMQVTLFCALFSSRLKHEQCSLNTSFAFAVLLRLRPNSMRVRSSNSSSTCSNGTEKNNAQPGHKVNTNKTITQVKSA